MDSLFKINILNIINFERDSALGEQMWWGRFRQLTSTLCSVFNQYPIYLNNDVFSLDPIIKINKNINNKELNDFLLSIPGFDKNSEEQSFQVYEHYGWLSMPIYEVSDKVKEFCDYKLTEKNLINVQNFIKKGYISESEYRDAIFDISGKKYFHFKNGLYSFEDNKIWIIDGYFIFSFDINTLENIDCLVFGDSKQFTSRHLKIFMNKSHVFNKMKEIDLLEIFENNILDEMELSNISDDEFTDLLEIKYAL